ncbi:MAG: methyltransferase domain-containing protein, partial [Desulfuromonadales bacterium]|nr:methyltransferase domain-containing protein [Desulfuromonadales bacterium]
MTELRVISKINPEASDADLMVPEIHDRILDAYFGKMGDQFMRDTQKRVHWVCGMAKGPRVLDIGCSQGIVPVLLGREGYTVTGIDSDSQAIAAAKTFLADQKPNVQTKVNFIHADFISFPFDGALFDTAIVSEVLEHLVDPASFVSRAAERLSPGGTLIVTVPFGINDFIDHKWTFYALEPLRLVWELFSVDEVEVFGKWIGFSCRKRNSKAKKGLTEWPWSLLEKMEKTFYVNERALLSQTEAVRAKLDEANNKYRSITEQVSLLKETLSRQEASQKKVDGLLQQSQVQLELVQSQAANERTEFKQQIVFLGEEVQAKSDAAHEVEKQLLRREAELEVVRAQIVAAELSYRSVAEQVVTLKEQLSKQESVRKRAEETQAQTIAELKKIQGQLDEQRSGFQQEIARLTADSLAKSTAAHKLEKQLHRRDVELEAVRGEVNLAEQKYRSGTEQLADIKEQLTQQEASRKLTEEIQAQTKSQMSRLSDECKGFQREIARLTADNRDKNDLIQKFEKELIHRQDELKLLCSRLEDVNQKYLIGSAQIETLQHDLEEAKSDRIIIENELKESLNNANIKYRQVTGQQIPLLKQKLELQNQRHKEKTELLRREAEVTASKVRDTLSFRLGYILLHCLKSHRNFMRLPKDLWLLRRESVRRRQKKFTLDLPVLKRKPEGGSEAPVRAAGPSIRADSVSILLSQHTIPQLNMTTGLVNLRVACIMDEFTFSSYAPECKLTQLTPTGWKAELESSAPELLFIESAWRGKDDLWGNKVGHTSQELQGVVEWCQQRRIPTLFWNKEDPVHFETFLNTARLFDYVFTTDIDCIHRYKAALKHERVFLLPFACQPKSHNPIEKYARKDAFCFAGAYYARYPERIKDLESFVDELPAFKPLEIFDRNFGKKDPNYTFPQYYQPCIVGTLLYTEIDRAYKGYRYAINLNSIKQSQSMFARRVYELLASNTITVSNFSRGVRLLFGDLVVTTDNGSEQVRRLKALTADDLNARKFRLAALRKVMQEHTYGQRLAYVASKLSGQKIESLLPKIAVLARAMTRSEITKILANFTRQSYQHATLHLVADKGLFSALPAAEERVVY